MNAKNEQDELLAADLGVLVKVIGYAQERIQASRFGKAITKPWAEEADALQRIHDRLSARPITTCYECDGELSGPHCPACLSAPPEKAKEAGDMVLREALEAELLHLEEDARWADNCDLERAASRRDAVRAALAAASSSIPAEGK